MNLEDKIFYDYDSSEESSVDDDVDYALADINLPKKKNEVESYYFEVLSTKEILQHMLDFIREANAFVCLPETITRILLNHFKWNMQQFVNSYFNEDKNRLFEEAHVVNPFKLDRADLLNQQSINETKECEICFVEIPQAMMTGLQCGHKFCQDCWNDYLKTKIMDDGVVQTIQCAANSCDIIVDDDNVMRLVKETKVKQKYQLLITNDFVEFHKLIKWCPRGCERAILVQHVEPKPVKCKCNYTFCFECGANWHEPIKCDLLLKWKKSCKADLKNNQWFINNAKNCPRCNVHIEKNGGCMHMTCRNRSCSYEFCWLCMGPWVRSHRCNSFNENHETSKLKAQQKIELNIQRYNFFSDRYMNHMQSLKFENQLHSNILAKMREAQKEHDMTWNEVCFLEKAVEVLVSCRQTLMYTYVLAFYLESNLQTAIFEDNQNDLENAVEVLSGYLERDIAVDNLTQLKPKVQDKYKYCDRRRVVLLEHINEGNDKNWWIF